MITSTRNNFGTTTPIQFNDYQSDSLCILNGTITIDPSNPTYISATQLELQLPTTFAMKRSAVSSAILLSSKPKTRQGTVLRCHIEDYTLIIEKLTQWDSYGTITIVVASAFVTRGYRGEYNQLQTTPLSFENAIEADRQYCVITDNYCALSIIFKNLLSSLFSDGPISTPLKGFPKDISLTIPLSVQDGSYETGQIGSYLATAQIENGHLNLEYEPSSINLSSKSFTCIFAVRGTYTPSPAKEGDLNATKDQLTPKQGVTIDEFKFKSHNSLSILSLNAQMQRNTDTIPFTSYLNDVPDYAAYSAVSPVLVRANATKKYAISFNKLCWSRHFGAFTIDGCSLQAYRNLNIFATSLYEFVNW